jgi:hypothetical protein
MIKGTLATHDTDEALDLKLRPELAMLIRNFKSLHG